MSVLIDVGCAKHGTDESIPHLVRDYAPTILYGYDPACDIYSNYKVEETRVIEKPEVAWTYDGEIGFLVARLGGHVEADAPSFPCFDLARFILELAQEEKEIILKMDAEGAEYTVLPHLCATDADLCLKLAIIEWHCEFCGIGGNGRHRDNCPCDRDWWVERRRSVEDALRCPTEEWNL
jgi:hypothetical protein